MYAKVLQVTDEQSESMSASSQLLANSKHTMLV